MIELRGIITDSPEGKKRVRLITRGQRGDDYTTLEYPKGKKLNRWAIISFLAKSLKVKPVDIKIAPHIKIPKEK